MLELEVFHWVHTKNWGGLEKFVTLLSAELNRAGCYSQLHYTQSNQVESSEKITELKETIHYSSIIKVLREILRNETPIVIHYTGATLHYALLIRLLHPRAKQVRIFMHSFSRKKDLYHRLVYWILDSCIFPTKISLEKAYSFLPSENNKFYFQYFGVPSQPRFHEVFNGKIIITSMSRIDKGKQILELVRAFAQFFEAHPDLAQLVCVQVYGSPHKHDQVGHKLYQQIKEIASHFGEALQILGHTDHPEQVLAQSNYLIFTSENEFYGFSLIEALSVGVPPITVDRGSFSELNGESFGFFINLDNQELFNKKIHQLINLSSEEYEERSQNAFLKYNQFFKIEETTQSLISHLNNL